jgi:type IX secretion system PorP/SprF family membrane protein
LGGSVHHINQPKESLYGDFAFVPRKYGVHGGYRFRFKPNPFKRSRNYIVTAFNYQAQGEFDQLDAGFYYELTPFTLGFWYRGLPTKKNNEGRPNHDAIAIILGYYAGPYRIGYSYDITISSLSVVNTTGAHEISLVYEWANKRNAKLAKRRVVPCAKF